jgi:hypothetical protein
VLIGGAEARNPEGCRISKRSTEIGGGCPIPCCSRERSNDRGGIVAEKALGQYHVIRPALHVVAGREEVGHLQTGPLTQSDEVDGLAPRCPFVSTPSCHHLTDHARQHIGRMLPADDVKTLESLIDEVERMSAIGVGAVRLGGKEEICECRR